MRIIAEHSQSVQTNNHRQLQPDTAGLNMSVRKHKSSQLQTDWELKRLRSKTRCNKKTQKTCEAISISTNNSAIMMLWKHPTPPSIQRMHASIHPAQYKHISYSTSPYNSSPNAGH
ncbi:hypothetical protein CEXT_130131 [Caerostris extrusa]|uniref:Uncharacterized protein n=1 Tax=Caerostris extrusa TaxID=172846 RepID=A0AAV4PRW8_CAEEX|nr:hypothetical protein CEXT_130131 [Caerostris extrusa]